jgi:hypothetical protein
MAKDKMADDKTANDKIDPQDPKKDESFDRLEYLRDIRRACLKRLELPEDAKPEMVLRLVKIKEEMSKIRKDGEKKELTQKTP